MHYRTTGVVEKGFKGETQNRKYIRDIFRKFPDRLKDTRYRLPEFCATNWKKVNSFKTLQKGQAPPLPSPSSNVIGS